VRELQRHPFEAEPQCAKTEKENFWLRCSIGIKIGFPFTYTLCNGSNILKALTHENLILFVVLPEVRNTAQVWRWCVHASHNTVSLLANSSGFHRPAEISQQYLG